MPGFSIRSVVAICTCLALTSGCASKATGGAQLPTPVAEDFHFENPGGMWMPAQMSDHVATLKKLGVTFDPAQLADPTSFPLGAVVSLGGCSASFVSPQGLVITNHHCVIGALQHNSTPSQNRLQDGYLATSLADELPAGPRQHMYVTQKVTNVTEEILKAGDAAASPSARFEAISARGDELEKACEAAQPGYSCQVRSFFEGAEYHMIEALEIRDVRLVFAPEAGIGVFGGEVDNWRWPRHTGDFSFLRAYVGPDGQPADPSPNNVPYQPRHHLKVAAEGLQPGDFVMVAGYPGQTNRWSTASEVREAMEWHYPRTIERFRENIDLLTHLGADRPELAIKTATRMRGMANYYTNYQGMLEGLSKAALAQRKGQQEGDLRKWIAADAAREAKYGDVLDQIETLQAEQRKTRAADGVLVEIERASTLLNMALAAVRHEPGKDDELAKRIDYLAASYDDELDRATLTLALRRAGRLAPEDLPVDAIKLIVRDIGVLADESKIRAAVDKLYSKTKLGTQQARAKLLGGADGLANSRDSIVKLAWALAPTYQDMQDRSEAFAGAMSTLRPKFVAALREFNKGPMAPDANGTLRITFGTVRGYAPTPGAEPCSPFSTLSEMLAKHTGQEPFIVPDSVLAAAKSDKGPYVDPGLNDVPLDFLADLDITGGNSGSATMNASGELVGLVFDGNYESIASNWNFMPEITRSIHVDIRFVQWVLDAVVEGDHLLREMGVEPKVATGAGPTVASAAR